MRVVLPSLNPVLSHIHSHFESLNLHLVTFLLSAISPLKAGDAHAD